MARCFPEKTHVVRSCDKPWVSRRMRRLIRRKKRAFRKWGKSEVYWQKANRAENEIKENKMRFFDKVKKKVVDSNNPREYYRAIKLLQTDDSSPQWSIKSLFPSLSDSEISEKSAEFFNDISNEFTPVDPPTSQDFSNLAPSSNEIRLRILKMKKPKTRVFGDIDCRLLKKYAAMLSVPLAIIFKQIFATLAWPEIWKRETVTLLPKNKSPSGLAQLRNISCTPFFSKLLETFILDGLKQTIKLSGSQFGGKKGQGVDHLLIETWDEIHRNLERGSTAVNIMAVDYQKAFNRLDHTKCIKALEDLGGRPEYIALVNAFLYNRKMTVKISNTYSKLRQVNGGAPQGSILGCFLFCAAINILFNVRPDRVPSGNMVDSTEISPIRGPAPDNYSSSESDGDEVGRFFSWSRPRRINDTIDSVFLDQSEARDVLEIDAPDTAPVVLGYIDDFNVIEPLDERLKRTHYTTEKTTATIHAQDSDSIFENLSSLSSDLGMKINPDKTQILCISSAAATDMTSFIRYEGKKIESSNELKILGF